MWRTILIILAVLIFASLTSSCSMVKTRQIEAETGRTEAEAGLVEAEASLVEAEAGRTKAEAGLVEAEAAAERDRELLALIQELVDVTRRQNTELLVLVQELTTQKKSMSVWNIVTIVILTITILAMLAIAGIIAFERFTKNNEQLALHRKYKQLPFGGYMIEMPREVDVVVIPPPLIEG